MKRHFRRWLRLPVTSRQMTESDVEAELSSHVEERVERLMAGGMPAAAGQFAPPREQHQGKAVRAGRCFGPPG